MQNDEEQKRIQEIQNRYKNFDVNSNQNNNQENYQSQNTSYEEFKKQKEEIPLKKESVYEENIYQKGGTTSSGINLGTSVLITIFSLFIIGTTSAYYLGAFDSSFNDRNHKITEEVQKKDIYDNDKNQQKEYKEKINNNSITKVIPIRDNKDIQRNDDVEVKNEKKEDKYSVKIQYIYDNNGYKQFKKIEFYKNSKVYKTIINNVNSVSEIPGTTVPKYNIYHSPNKKYLAIFSYGQDYEGIIPKEVRVYDKNGRYLWHGLSRNISYLSNNGNYFVYTENPDGACYNICEYSYVTKRYGKDIKLDGGLQNDKSFKFLSNGGVKMTLMSKNGNNYVELNNIGELVKGRLWYDYNTETKNYKNKEKKDIGYNIVDSSIIGFDSHGENGLVVHNWVSKEKYGTYSLEVNAKNNDIIFSKIRVKNNANEIIKDIIIKQSIPDKVSVVKTKDGILTDENIIYNINLNPGESKTIITELIINNNTKSGDFIELNGEINLDGILEKINSVSIYITSDNANPN